MKLNPEPAKLLTLREVAKILCGLLGTLLDMSDRKTVEDAIVWAYENHKEVLDVMEHAREIQARQGQGGSS